MDSDIIVMSRFWYEKTKMLDLSASEKIW